MANGFIYSRSIPQIRLIDGYDGTTRVIIDGSESADSKIYVNAQAGTGLPAVTFDVDFGAGIQNQSAVASNISRSGPMVGFGGIGCYLAQIEEHPADPAEGILAGYIALEPRRTSPHTVQNTAAYTVFGDQAGGNTWDHALATVGNDCVITTNRWDQGPGLDFLVNTAPGDGYDGYAGGDAIFTLGYGSTIGGGGNFIVFPGISPSGANHGSAIFWSIVADQTPMRIISAVPATADLTRWEDPVGTLLAAVTGNGHFQMIDGASPGFVLTSDAAGIASWQPPGDGYDGYDLWLLFNDVVFPLDTDYDVVVGDTAMSGAGEKFRVAGDSVVDGWLSVGTSTDAVAVGDLSAGLTGAARIFYDQSSEDLTFYDNLNQGIIQIQALNTVSTLPYVAIGFGTVVAPGPINPINPETVRIDSPMSGLRIEDTIFSGGYIEFGDGQFAFPSLIAPEARLIYHAGMNSLAVSYAGAPYIPLSAATAGGWTDDGVVVRLTTVTDAVGIGTPTPTAGMKLHVVGDTYLQGDLWVGIDGYARMTYSQPQESLTLIDGTDQATILLDAFTNGGYIGIGATAVMGPVGGEQLNVDGDVNIGGKLTVTGVIDPITVIVEDKFAGTGAYYEAHDGSSAASVLPFENIGRLRYNDVLERWEVSTPISAGWTGLQTDDGYGDLWFLDGYTVYPQQEAWNVAVGSSSMFGTDEKFFVDGRTVVDSGLIPSGGDGLYFTGLGDSGNASLAHFDLNRIDPSPPGAIISAVKVSCENALGDGPSVPTLGILFDTPSFADTSSPNAAILVLGDDSAPNTQYASIVTCLNQPMIMSTERFFSSGDGPVLALRAGDGADDGYGGSVNIITGSGDASLAPPGTGRVAGSLFIATGNADSNLSHANGSGVIIQCGSGSSTDGEIVRGGSVAIQVGEGDGPTGGEFGVFDVSETVSNRNVRVDFDGYATRLLGGMDPLGASPQFEIHSTSNVPEGPGPDLVLIAANGQTDVAPGGYSGGDIQLLCGHGNQIGGFAGDGGGALIWCGDGTGPLCAGGGLDVRLGSGQASDGVFTVTGATLATGEFVRMVSQLGDLVFRAGVDGWVSIGSSNDASAYGDLTAGIDGYGRMSYDQSSSSLLLYDSFGAQTITLDAVSNSGFVGIGAGATAPYATESLYVDGSEVLSGNLTFTAATVSPLISHEDTTGATTTLSIFAQSTTDNTVTGGNVLLQAGSAGLLGSSAGGSIFLQPGDGDTEGRVIIRTASLAEMVRFYSDTGVVDFGAGTQAVTALGNPTFHFGTSLSTFGGDVQIDGKLTVDGYLDPIGVIIESATDDAFLELGEGQNAALSPTDTARIIYDDLTTRLMVSVDGGPYTPLLTGTDSDGYWARDPSGFLYPEVIGDDIAIGANPADSGVIRIPNSEFIRAPQVVGIGDVSLIGLDSSDVLLIGDTNASNRPGTIRAVANSVFVARIAATDYLTVNATHTSIDHDLVVGNTAMAGPERFYVDAGTIAVAGGGTLLRATLDDDEVNVVEVEMSRSNPLTANEHIAGVVSYAETLATDNASSYVSAFTAAPPSIGAGDPNDCYAFLARTPGPASSDEYTATLVAENHDLELRSTRITPGSGFDANLSGGDAMTDGTGGSVSIIAGDPAATTGPNDANPGAIVFLAGSSAEAIGADQDDGGGVWMTTGDGASGIGGGSADGGNIVMVTGQGAGGGDGGGLWLADVLFHQGQHIQIADGQNAATSNINTARLIYNQATGTFQASFNTAPYIDLATGGPVVWTRDVAGFVYPSTTTDQVVVGASSVVGLEALRVTGGDLLLEDDFTFGVNTVTPTISQTTTAAGNAENMSILAQSTTDDGYAAGSLWITGGQAPATAMGSFGGSVILAPGDGDTEGSVFIRNASLLNMVRLWDDLIDFAGGVGTVTATGNPTWDFGTSQATFGGDVDIAGKLTVDGYIDPVAVIIESATADAFLELGNGQNAGLSGLGDGRLRYNDATGRFEVSEGGGSYVQIATGTGAGPWNEAGGVVYPDNAAWNVVVGDTSMAGSETFRVAGDSRLEGWVEIGTILPGAGAIRLENDASIIARNATDDGNITVIGTDISNNLLIGDNDGYLADVIIDVGSGQHVQIQEDGVTALDVTFDQVGIGTVAPVAGSKVEIEYTQVTGGRSLYIDQTVDAIGTNYGVDVAYTRNAAATAGQMIAAYNTALVNHAGDSGVWMTAFHADVPTKTAGNGMFGLVFSGDEAAGNNYDTAVMTLNQSCNISTARSTPGSSYPIRLNTGYPNGEGGSGFLEMESLDATATSPGSAYSAGIIYLIVGDSAAGANAAAAGSDIRMYTGAAASGPGGGSVNGGDVQMVTGPGDGYSGHGGGVVLSGTGHDEFYLQINDSQNAAVSPGNSGRLIYDTSVQQFMISQDGAPYVPIATDDGYDSEWDRNGTIIYPRQPFADTVVVGGMTPTANEVLHVEGQQFNNAGNILSGEFGLRVDGSLGASQSGIIYADMERYDALGSGSIIGGILANSRTMASDSTQSIVASFAALGSNGTNEDPYTCALLSMRGQHAYDGTVVTLDQDMVLNVMLTGALGDTDGYGIVLQAANAFNNGAGGDITIASGSAMASSAGSYTGGDILLRAGDAAASLGGEVDGADVTIRTGRADSNGGLAAHGGNFAIELGDGSGAGYGGGVILYGGDGYDAFMQFEGGENALTSPAGSGRLRYNGVLNRWEESSDGNPYQPLVGGGGAGDGYWSRDPSGVLYPEIVSDSVVIGDSALSGTENFKAYGRSLIESDDANNTPLTVMAAPGQIENIVEIQDGSSDVMVSINAAGNLIFDDGIVARIAHADTTGVADSFFIEAQSSSTGDGADMEILAGAATNPASGDGGNLILYSGETAGPGADNGSIDFYSGYVEHMASLKIDGYATLFEFNPDVTPVILQENATTGDGRDLTIMAQPGSDSGADTNGGNLVLVVGDGYGANGRAGLVEINGNIEHDSADVISGVAFGMSNETTDATPTRLFLDGVSQELQLEDDSSYVFDILVTVINSDNGNVASWHFYYSTKHYGGTVSEVNAPDKTVISDESTGAWDCDLDVDTGGNDELDIICTGALGNNLKWGATVKFTKVEL